MMAVLCEPGELFQHHADAVVPVMNTIGGDLEDDNGGDQRNFM
jgi:hypothetical protein